MKRVDNIICGITAKNYTNEVVENVYDMSDTTNVLVADIDFFIENHDSILELAQNVKARDP